MTILDVIESLRKDPWRKFYRRNWKNLSYYFDSYITKTNNFDELTLVKEDPEYAPLPFTPTWSDFLATDWREIEQPQQIHGLSLPDAIKHIYRNISEANLNARRRSWRGKRSISLNLESKDNPILILNLILNGFDIPYQPTVSDILASDWEITS